MQKARVLLQGLVFCERENNINLIKAKLISISDLIIILTDCYINDTDLNDQITFENFEHHLTVLENEFLKKMI